MRTSVIRNFSIIWTIFRLPSEKFSPLFKFKLNLIIWYFVILPIKKNGLKGNNYNGEQCIYTSTKVVLLLLTGPNTQLKNRSMLGSLCKRLLCNSVTSLWLPYFGLLNWYLSAESKVGSSQSSLPLYPAMREIL